MVALEVEVGFEFVEAGVAYVYSVGLLVLFGREGGRGGETNLSRKLNT